MFFSHKLQYLLIIFLTLLHTVGICIEKTQYSFTTDPIDVVIPCAASDQKSLDLCIEGIRKNGKNIRRIIVVSGEQLTEKAEWFDEKKYPFTKNEICLAMFHNQVNEAAEYSRNGYNRLGWIYQQLLKLYASRVIPDISPNILILDADVVFLNPVEFTDSQGSPFFATAGENMEPYFKHMSNLLPWLKRETEYSGITHHMLFQRCVLDDLFQMIEERHKSPAWAALAACIVDYHWACLSEYEIYFNFILARSNQAAIRPLKWTNSEYLKDLPTYREKGFHFVACHGWMRKD